MSIFIFVALLFLAFIPQINHTSSSLPTSLFYFPRSPIVIFVFASLVHYVKAYSFGITQVRPNSTFLIIPSPCSKAINADLPLVMMMLVCCNSTCRAARATKNLTAYHKDLLLFATVSRKFVGAADDAARRWAGKIFFVLI